MADTAPEPANAAATHSTRWISTSPSCPKKASTNQDYQ